MIKLSDYIKEDWKNKKVNEGLLSLILVPLGIYYISQWLANLFEKIADYQDGFDSKLIKAQKQIVANVGGDDIINKINKAYASGASSARLAKIYVSHPETQKEINKFKNDKRVAEAGGIKALTDALEKLMTRAYEDDELEKSTVKDLKNKLS